MSLRLDVPRELPGDLTHLSHSSVSTYLGCPERWRRRYLELEYEPPNGNMTCGKVVGRAVAAGYLDKIASGKVNTELLEDTFATEWDEAAQEVEDWEDENPDTVKDSAVDSLRAYAVELMPFVTPITVEEGFEIQFPEADWNVIGYLDFTDAVAIYDLKTSKRQKTQADIDSDDQATMYVAGKQLQTGDLAPFRWHSVKRPSPGGRSPAAAVELKTERTQFQVNSYLERIAQVARELDWRVSSGDWQGAAPGFWKCSAKGCGYWDTCRFGGQR